VNTDKLRERIRELTEQRDQFIQQANGQIAAFNGAIGELERLIESLTADEPDDETAILNGGGAKIRGVKKELA
jgi:hypothetical protein